MVLTLSISSRSDDCYITVSRFRNMRIRTEGKKNIQELGSHLIPSEDLQHQFLRDLERCDGAALVDGSEAHIS